MLISYFSLKDLNICTGYVVVLVFLLLSSHHHPSDKRLLYKLNCMIGQSVLYSYNQRLTDRTYDVVMYGNAMGMLRVE